MRSASISTILCIFLVDPFGVPSAYLTVFRFLCIISLVKVGKDIKFLEGVESTFTAHLFSHQPQETAKTMAPSRGGLSLFFFDPWSYLLYWGIFLFLADFEGLFVSGEFFLRAIKIGRYLLL